MPSSTDRRTFLQAGAALAAGAAWRGRGASAPAPLPTRKLGKTGLDIPLVGLGTACCGQSNTVTMEETLACYQAALDEGILWFDAARIYGKAEEALSRVLKGKRDQVLVTTKSGPNDPDGAQRSFDESLKQLGMDHVDVLYLHECGMRDLKRAMDPGGVLDWLEQQKKAGKARFIGATAHARAASVVPLIETGRLDVTMFPINYVDTHQYHFEQHMLAAARKQGMGVVGMKVFGGISGRNWSRYIGPNLGPQVAVDRLQSALRYCLSQEGVTCAVLGMHTPEQVRQNLAWAREFKPLDEVEMKALLAEGEKLVNDWSARFGPVA
ncbi:MAG: aldo/keto reductase [Armatimonadetes bacterium]|nr:aldo/keto reductase [Armatimonadota bacterium]